MIHFSAIGGVVGIWCVVNCAFCANSGVASIKANKGSIIQPDHTLLCAFGNMNLDLLVFFYEMRYHYP